MRNLREHKMIKMRGIMGILLSLVLVMAMVPALPVKADTTPDGWTKIYHVSEILELENSGENASGKYILMDNDTNQGTIEFTKNWIIILDLNGHTTNQSIRLSGMDSSPKGSFTVMDSKGGGAIVPNSTLVINSVVEVSQFYSFTLEGGTLSCSVNIASCCGVGNYGTFNMKGGTISGNSSTGGAGGVDNHGTFNMSGGTISGNSSTGGAGGVDNAYLATFNMTGGTISGNSSTGGAGGVNNWGTFNMSGGTISGNTSNKPNNPDNEYPGGVYNSRTFNMSNGTISNNTGPKEGGVESWGPFNMTGGEITGNHGSRGAGILMCGHNNSTISGGTITGNYITNTNTPEDICIWNVDGYQRIACLLSGAPSIGTIRFRIQYPEDSPSLISLSGALSNKTPIKVDVADITTPFTFTKKSESGPNPSDYIECFTAYDASKGIGYSGNELLLADATPPIISGTSDDISLETGYESKNQLSVSASAAGDHELSYKWYSNTTNSNTGGTKIDGATSTTYNLPMGLTAGNKYYYCVVTSTNTTTHVKSSLASRAIKVSVLSVAERCENKQGENTTWNPDSGSPLGFIFKTIIGTDDVFIRFTGIEVDGKTVPEKDSNEKLNWIASEGSLIIDLQPSFLATLDVGDHTLSVLFDDGSKITTSFSISRAAQTNGEGDMKDTTTHFLSTGDGKDFTVYIALLLMYISIVLTASVGGMKAIEYSQTRRPL